MNIRVLVTVVLLTAFTLTTTHAYIPAADRILDTLSRMHRRVSAVVVHGETTIYGSEGNVNTSSVREKLYLGQGGAYRSERGLSGNESILVGNNEKVVISGVNGDEADLRRIDCVLPRILLQPSTDRLIHDLSTLGVDTSVISFDRIEKTVCYVIGTNDGTSSGSALWVEKERGLPLRFTGFLPLPEGMGAFRAEYKNYGLVDKQFWFPRTIEIYRDDRLLALMEVMRIETAPHIDGRLFDTDGTAVRGVPITNFISIKE